MFGRKRTFKEIREEEISQDLSLYYMYVYIKNYEDEEPREQRNIREYYDKNLRYTGAFYRDRKYFEINGNPENWDLKRKERFKTTKNHDDYVSGLNIFKTFIHKSTYLVNLDLSKPVSIELINIMENKIHLSLYESETRTELTRLKNLIMRIDQTNHKIMIKKGFEPALVYDLEMVQVIFKVQVNNYVRYFSTRFMNKKFIVDVALNKLNSYISTLIKLDSHIEQTSLSKSSNPADEYLDVEFAEIQRIHIVKRTDIQRHGLGRNVPYPFDFEQSLLTSMVII